jgi:hypothetical protein
MFTVAFMINDPEDDSRVQQYRGQDEPPRHLWIIDPQRIACWAMHGLVQNRGNILLQKLGGFLKPAFIDLDVVHHLWWTQEKEIAKPFVIIRAGLETFVAQESLQSFCGFDALEDRHIVPRLLSK